MKSKTIQLVAISFLSIGTIFAQDVPTSQVPSVIINNFKKEFPKAHDIDWEMQGDLYNVDFEIEWFTDYEAWFNAQYKEYRIEDAKKIIENGVETYKVELEKWDEDFDVIYSKNGNLIK